MYIYVQYVLLTSSIFFVQMFFEDHIDDAKYCGHLYGLGTGSAYVQNGTGNAYEEEANKQQSWRHSETVLSFTHGAEPKLQQKTLEEKTSMCRLSSCSPLDNWIFRSIWGCPPTYSRCMCEFSEFYYYEAA